MLHVRRIEVAYIQACQTGTTAEHALHALYFSCLEATHVKARQVGTFIEHIVHLCHVLSIEVGCVNDCQGLTTHEHPVHVRHVVGLQIFQARNRGQILTVTEPKSCTGQAGTISK